MNLLQFARTQIPHCETLYAGARSKSMREIWLRTNRRAILFGCVPPLLLALLGAWILFRETLRGEPFWLGGLILALGLASIGLLVTQLLRPRVAFSNDKVLFYVRSGRPIEVPVHVVEAFFAGQGPAHLPAVSKQPQTVNLVARLSQRHPEWAEQEVKPALGKWAESYVSICGTWCEPLNADLIRKLNRRLKEVKDEIAASSN